jgi:hypothetical protein
MRALGVTFAVLGILALAYVGITHSWDDMSNTVRVSGAESTNAADVPASVSSSMVLVLGGVGIFLLGTRSRRPR